MSVEHSDSRYFRKNTNDTTVNTTSNVAFSNSSNVPSANSSNCRFSRLQSVNTSFDSCVESRNSLDIEKSAAQTKMASPARPCLKNSAHKEYPDLSSDCVVRNTVLNSYYIPFDAYNFEGQDISDKKLYQASKTADSKMASENSEKSEKIEPPLTATVVEMLPNSEPVITLDKNNMIKAKLTNRESIIALVDSGASHSLICAKTVASSQFLSKLPKRETEPLKFQVGNGQHIWTSYAIEIPLVLGNHKFIIDARACSYLGGISLILGTDSLVDIDAKMDFKSRQLRFKNTSINVHSVHDTKLLPNQSKLVSITGKLPHFLRNNQAMLRLTKFGSQFTATNSLVKFHSGKASIVLYNPFNRAINLHKNKPIASIRFQDLANTFHPFNCNSHLQPDQAHCFRTSKVAKSPKSVKVSTPPVQDQSAMSTEQLKASKLAKYPHLESSDPRLTMTDVEILNQDVKLDDCVLSFKDKAKLQDLLVHYKEAFSLHSEIGNTDLTVDFELNDDSSFYIRPFTVSQAEKPIIDKELSKLEKMGVIRQGTSQYSSPVMLVKKKDTTALRLCTDFRHLNTKIKKRNLPFPLLRDTIQIIGHAQPQVLSVIDLKEAYHSLSLSKKASSYCGITSYFGGKSYVYNKLPMGLSISPAEFQIHINNIIAQANASHFCVAIMDDLLLFSKDQNDHFAHVETILKALQENGLKISPSKAKLFRKEVVYMGHKMIIQHGKPAITPLRERTEAIRNLQLPDTKRKLKGFIGKVSYLSMYLPHLQILLQPLHKIASKKATFIWDETTQTAYDKIIKCLIKPPVLSMPTSTGLFRLYCDTSKVGVGSSLWQIQHGQERLLGYFSKALPRAAANYSITELELTGLLISVQAFRHLLRSTSFEVYTDHAAIPQIMKSKVEPPSERIKRLLEKLSSYSMKIGYRKGSSMVIADYLSRNPQFSNESNSTIAFPVTRSKVTPTTEFAVYEKPKRTRKRNDPQPPPPPQEAAPLPAQPAPQPQQVPQPNQEQEPPPRQEPQKEPQDPPVRRPPQIPISALKAAMKPPPAPPATSLVEATLQQEVTETHRETPQHFLQDPQELTISRTKAMLRHLPQQKKIQQHLDSLRSSLITTAKIPFFKKDLATQQATCPNFKHIYAYIKHGTLPFDKKESRTIVLKAESFLIIDDILFKIASVDNTTSFQIALPQVLVPQILSLYHDSLLACHQGIVRVSQTIKRDFYFPRLHQQVYDYVRTCTTCQSRKSPVAEQRTFKLNIPADYSPFQSIYADLKQMPPSVLNHRYILTLVCQITRYVILIPLENKEATSVAEAILQRCVFIHGPFKQFISDRGREFDNQVIKFIFKAMKVDHHLVSVGNHQANKAERFVGTIANMLTSCLQENGANWHLYCVAVAYAYNSFSIPSLGNYSPYYLVHLRNPPTLFDVNPVDKVTTNYKEYVALLKARFDTVSRTVLRLQTHLQHQQSAAQANQSTTHPYSEGILVYLLAPTAASLQTSSKKIRMDYVGPLVITAMKDDAHAFLSTLEGQSLAGDFHISRLKPAWIRTDNGPVNSISRLTGMLKKKTQAITDESGKQPDTAHRACLLFQSTQPISTDRVFHNAKINGQIASSIELTVQQRLRMQAFRYLSEGTYEVTKSRFKNGSLQFCLAKESASQAFWITADHHPSLAEIAHDIQNSSERINGSQRNFLHQVLGI